MTDIQKENKNPVFYQLTTFQYALRGIRSFFFHETKSWIHLIAAVLAIISGIVSSISLTEWLMITFAVGLVFVSEIFNTAIELVVDQVTQKRTRPAGLIKDLAAAAVLFAAMTALVIALLIFIPKIPKVLCIG